ncbi:MAG: DNA starvation/stationary phase protection protein Dps [Acidobacteria bacterium]|nr:DNA starvation/stationary phase protection protein Dps [Acidobacteriota bacterium]MBI3470423.1 DNA starvation/stationary phase protection protein Dps [Candidatus Solibacter usitatus]
MQTTTVLHSTRIDLPAQSRQPLVQLLNQQLADAVDLYSQTKQAHWNVKGPQFFSLHQLFDKLAGELEGHIDSLAERATALGGTARGTLRQAAAVSRIPEYPAAARESREHLEALGERFAAYAASTRAAIRSATELGDASTADLFTEISRDADKGLWFLEAHLQTAA